MKRKFNKKGQIGLNTVRAVMIAFFTLVVLVIAFVLAGVSLRDASDSIDKLTVTFTNTSTSAGVTETGTNVSGTGNLRNCVLTATQVSKNGGNASCRDIISAGNYTITNCRITYSGGDKMCANVYNNTVWNVTGSYQFNGNDITDATTNVTNAFTGFFDDTDTIFNILVAIVIILAIGIAILVVSRFGGATPTGVGSAGSGGSFGGVGNGGFRLRRGGSGGSSVSGI